MKLIFRDPISFFLFLIQNLYSTIKYGDLVIFYNQIAVFLFTFFGSCILPIYGNCGIIMLFPNITIKFGGKRNGIRKFSKNFNRR